MRQETSNGKVEGRRAGALAAVAVAGAFAVLTAGSARADGDFENAFEATLGQLVAYEAVNLGRYVLAGGYYGPPPVRYYRPAYAYGYGYYGYGYPLPAPVPVRHVVKYKNVYKHKHGRGCGHGSYDRDDDDGRWYGHGHGRGHGRGW